MYIVHVGALAGTFALGACFSARLREKDDYKNAVVGGMLAGSIFGFRSKFRLECNLIFVTGL